MQEPPLLDRHEQAHWMVVPSMHPEDPLEINLFIYSYKMATYPYPLTKSDLF